MLTIIGGKWRGRKLHVPRSDKVRPSSSKVRGALFNILESMRMKAGHEGGFAGLSCLDLCAGSGALGFEALSRGADRALFVEKSREHARIIAANAAELGAEASIDLLCAPVEAAFAKLAGKGPFGLVLADPPYDFPGLQALVDSVAADGVLAEDGIFVLEHGPKTKVCAPEPLVLHSERKLGPASISVFTRRSKGDMLKP